MKYLMYLLAIGMVIPASVQSQQLSYSDIEYGYARLLIEKGRQEGSYRKIGSFKVQGSPYLYGGNQKADVFLKEGFITDRLVAYDTYNQVLAVNTGEEGKYVFKKVNEIDSFTLKVSNGKDYTSDLNFVNASVYDPKKETMLQVLSAGPRLKLFKVYKTDLGYISSSYAQSDFREFQLSSEYYYFDTATKAFKKLKTTYNSLKKEFKSIKDVSSVLDDAEANVSEFGLVKLFSFLNN